MTNMSEVAAPSSEISNQFLKELIKITEYGFLGIK